MTLIDPITRRRFERFRANRMGWWSLLTFMTLAVLAALGPLLVGKRPLVMRINEELRFPVFAGFISGKELGLNSIAEPNYRLLALELNSSKRGWILMPVVPFAPDEVCEVAPAVHQDLQGNWSDPRGVIAEGRIFSLNPDGSRRQIWSVANGHLNGDARLMENGSGVARAKLTTDKVTLSIPASRQIDWQPRGALFTLIPSPCPPGLDGHWLGTDESGHDMVARLFGGFRILLLAALIYLPCVYAVGLILGASMGYFGGWFDLIVQRLIEIFSNMPFLFVVIIFSRMVPDRYKGLPVILTILIAFGWMGMTFLMRTAAYRDRERDYIAAARVLGAGTPRILFLHLLPNTVAILVTLVPFTLSGLIFSLTSLDYLGFGLPPDYATWGRLLNDGLANLSAPWLVTSTFIVLVGMLVLITFVGEAIREAIDPKKFTYYR